MNSTPAAYFGFFAWRWPQLFANFAGFVYFLVGLFLSFFVFSWSVCGTHVSFWMMNYHASPPNIFQWWKCKILHVIRNVLPENSFPPQRWFALEGSKIHLSLIITYVQNVCVTVQENVLVIHKLNQSKWLSTSVWTFASCFSYLLLAWTVLRIYHVKI